MLSRRLDSSSSSLMLASRLERHNFSSLGSTSALTTSAVRRRRSLISGLTPGIGVTLMGIRNSSSLVWTSLDYGRVTTYQVQFAPPASLTIWRVSVVHGTFQRFVPVTH